VVTVIIAPLRQRRTPAALFEADPRWPDGRKFGNGRARPGKPKHRVRGHAHDCSCTTGSPRGDGGGARCCDCIAAGARRREWPGRGHERRGAPSTPQGPRQRKLNPRTAMTGHLESLPGDGAEGPIPGSLRPHRFRKPPLKPEYLAELRGRGAKPLPMGEAKGTAALHQLHRVPAPTGMPSMMMGMFPMESAADARGRSTIIQEAYKPGSPHLYRLRAARGGRCGAALLGSPLRASGKGATRLVVATVGHQGGRALPATAPHSLQMHIRRTPSRCSRPT